MKYIVDYNLNGAAIFEASDAEDAEFQAREYVTENYPELNIDTFAVNTING